MLTLENVSKRYGTQTALHPVTLAFECGRTSALIGPSGCGKSTLLRMIVGLCRPDSGRVVIDDVELCPDTAQRLRHGIGYVIQEGGLFPHLTAEQNVALLARHLGRPSGWIVERISQLIDLLKITRQQLERYPHELSGGQRQRVGLMRALMLDPPLLLLDEPLAALDPVTRYELQDELKGIFDALCKTVVLVTHDMSEAAHFGDAIVMLRAGRIVQQGTLNDFLKRPADDFVRTFMRAQRTVMPETGE